MFVTNWISTTKIQKISEITNFFRHYFLSRTEVIPSLSKLELLKHFSLSLYPLLNIIRKLREEIIAGDTLHFIY